MIHLAYGGLSALTAFLAMFAIQPFAPNRESALRQRSYTYAAAIGVGVLAGLAS